MEKSEITKIGLAMSILVILGLIGLAFSNSKKDLNPQPADIIIGGDAAPSPSILEEEEIERVREELAPAPEENINKEEIREELSAPAPTPSGELSEAEKERIRAELRK